MPAGEAADPREYFFEEDAEDEGAFVVVEVGDADDDGGVRASVGVSQDFTSSVVPSRQVAKVGEARRVLRVAGGRP